MLKKDSRWDVLYGSETESLHRGLEHFYGSVFQVLELLVAAELSERAVLVALDHEELVETVVSAALLAGKHVLLGDGAVTLHLSRLLVEFPERRKRGQSQVLDFR